MDKVADIKSEPRAGFKSESVAGFLLECLAGFVGIRTPGRGQGRVLHYDRSPGPLHDVVNEPLDCSGAASGLLQSGLRAS